MIFSIDFAIFATPAINLIKSLVSYYGLKDYISFQCDKVFGASNVLEIEAYNHDNLQGDQVFWEKVLSKQLLIGQKLRLKNFQISPWYPRVPGQYWTPEAVFAREYAVDRHIEDRNAGKIIFDIYGKTLTTHLGGIGSVNFKKNRDFVFITATASGMTDEGIPIICRKNVWQEIEKKFNKQNKVEVDIEGTLVDIDPAINNSFFLRAGGVPRVAVSVNSILNIKIMASALKIDACPWTIFQTTNKHTPYGFTYKTHTVFADDITATNKWLNDYVENHNGKTVLTDYDENRSHLDAIFPLCDAAIGNIVDNKLMEYLQKINKAFKK